MLPAWSASAEHLFRRARAVRAVQVAQPPGDAMSSDATNIFSQALLKLEKVSQRMQSPLAIVGGLAGIYYQSMVTTLDIDVVVGGDRLDDFLRECAAEGLEIKRRSEHGWHTVVYRAGHESVEINVVPEGGKTPRDPAFAPPTPSPAELGVTSGLGYASFAGWVVLKLVANRDKDRYHLIESLKHASEAQVAEVVVKLRPLDASYLREFHRLFQAAHEESQHDW
jgi:hypothetical protein